MLVELLGPLCARCIAHVLPAQQSPRQGSGFRRPTRPVTTPLLALLVLRLLALLVPAARGLLPDEARAEADQLLAFKDGFINGAAALSSWVGEDACAGTWQGVVCLGGYVTELRLNGSSLQGTLPRAGWSLPPSLQALDLSSNTIRGSLPTGWSTPNLKELRLSYNPLSGPIPNRWAPAPLLRVLALDGAQLTGTLPAGLPRSLWELHLAGNRLEGGLPGNYTLPPELEQLDLSGNPLGGAIDPAWSLPRGLQGLALHQCQLTGELPGEWVSALPESLQQLSVWGNNLTGPLPALNESSLEVLVLPGNEGLCGPVPPAPVYINVPHAPDGNETLLPADALPACPAELAM